MPDFKKPDFEYDYDVTTEIIELWNYRNTKPGRQIPSKGNNNLLIATWNIANLGSQERNETDYRLIATMINWFDIIAVQEVKDDLCGLREIMRYLPLDYKLLFSDKAGNNERLAFIYDSRKLTLLEKVGEVGVPPSEHRHIKIDTVDSTFNGYDRNPFFATFQAGAFRFILVNAHLIFGSDKKKASLERRALEAFAVGRWADLRRDSDNAYTKDIIVIGDLNIPKASAGDPIYDALVERGLYVPAHSNKICSAMATDNEYDQIAFFSGQTRDEYTDNMGVFDFDGPLFQDLYNNRGIKDLQKYLRYYISDHRILWAEFRI